MASCGSWKELTEEEITEIRCSAIDWALANGISMRPSKLSEDQDKVVFTPFTLFPSTIPRYCLQEATETMEHFNRLMHKVAMDHDFLKNSFESIIKVDGFMKNLWEIYAAVRHELVQSVFLGFLRNDFMFEKKGESGDVSLKQVEINTIAAGFCGLGSKLEQFFGYIMDSCGRKYRKEQLPESNPSKGFASGFLQAWQTYGNENAVILFLVSHNESNIMDQKLLECEVYRQNKNIRIIRKTFDDLIKTGRLTEDRKYMVGEEEVAVVYYRVGYAPQDYSTHKTWSVRLDLEKSWSIKCPPIHYQLAGAKKIQQVLAKPDVLKNYIPDDNIRQRIQATFASQYSLDMGHEGDEAIRMAIEHPENFVLKPQREGGGNNLYGEDMKNFLLSVENSPVRSSYILMDIINSTPHLNYIVKSGVPFTQHKCVSELGIYGCFIGQGEREICNSTCGHILRTKLADTQEGGVSAGFGGLDFPFLDDTTD